MRTRTICALLLACGMAASGGRAAQAADAAADCRSAGPENCAAVPPSVTKAPTQANGFDVQHGSHMLKQVRKACAELTGNAWRLADMEPDSNYGTDTPNLPKTPQKPQGADAKSLDDCQRGVFALGVSKRETGGWTGTSRRKRERILLRCETALEDCRTQGNCTQLPLCVAAVENAVCGSLGQCVNWLGRRLNAFQSQEEQATRELMEQASARRQQARIADDELQQRRVELEQAGFYSILQAAREERANEDARNAARIANADSMNRTAILQSSLQNLVQSINFLASQAKPPAVSDSKIVPQLDPDKSLALSYPLAGEIAYGVAILPDSGVPRHRRYYELALRNLILGMSDADYVLDSYYDPWIEYRGQPGKIDPATDRWMPERQKEDARYGILVFRRDDWREDDGAKTSSLRVLFVVPEAVTYGVRQASLFAAFWRIAMETGTPGPAASPRQRTIRPPTLVHEPSTEQNATPGFDTSCKNCIFVIGPTFSSSVDSLARAEATFHAALKQFPLLPLSSAETVARLRANVEKLEKRPLPLPNGTEAGTTPSVERLSRIGELRRCAQALEPLAAPKERFADAVAAAAADAAAANPDDGRATPTTTLAERKRKALDACMAADSPAAAPNGRTVAAKAATSAATGQTSRRTCPVESANPLASARQKSFTACDRNVPGGPDAALLDAICGDIRTLRDALCDAPDEPPFETRALSATATADTNTNIHASSPTLRIASLATPDRQKLEEILARVGAKASIAILFEPTSFGRGTLASLRKLEQGKKRALYELAFPPNLADLRQRLRDGDDKARRTLSLIRLAADDAHLPLEEGVENGNEFPDTGNSALTAVSADQQIRQMLRQLQKIQPDAIILAATDVRDRLYLFDRISRELSPTWRFDMEADLLLSHPDYVHGTRGALMLSSWPLIPGDPKNPLRPVGCGDADKSASSTPADVRLNQFDSDRDALTYTIANCLEKEIRQQQKVFVYEVGRRGPIAAAPRPAASAGATASACGTCCREHDGAAGRPGCGTSAAATGAGARLLERLGGGLAADAASWYGTVLLLICVALVATALWIDFSQVRVPPAPQLTAPWWDRRLIDWPHAGRVTLGLILLALLLVPFLSPIQPLVLDRWRLLQAALVLLAAAAQVLWLCAARRFKAWIYHAQLLIQATNDNKGLGEWSGLAGAKPAFVGTPLEAGISSKLTVGPGLPELTPAVVAQTLSAMELGYADSLLARMTLRALLLPGLRLQSLFAAASLLASAAVLLIAWLYPAPGRLAGLGASLILFTFATTRLSGAAVAFERNGLLSRLFCGTEAGLQVSTQLVIAVAGPLVLLVLSLVATDQPGVLEIGGGIIQWIKGGK